MPVLFDTGTHYTSQPGCHNVGTTHYSMFTLLKGQRRCSAQPSQERAHAIMSSHLLRHCCWGRTGTTAATVILSYQLLPPLKLAGANIAANWQALVIIALHMMPVSCGTAVPCHIGYQYCCHLGKYFHTLLLLTKLSNCTCCLMQHLHYP